MEKPQAVVSFAPHGSLKGGRPRGNKILVEAWVLVVYQNGFKEVIDVRCYMGPSKSANTVYASIWVHTPTYESSCKGQAGGYGYDKVAAAVQDAFDNGGWELLRPVGSGSEAIEDALKTIAQHLGYEHFHIVHV